MTETIYYIEVALALEGSWQNNVFTYKSRENVAIGAVVIVPFGKNERLGYVIGQVAKPSFDAKEINKVTEYVLSTQTLHIIEWLSSYYPSAKGMHVQHFLPRFLLKNSAASIKSKEPINHPIKSLPPLTKEQLKAFKQLSNSKKVLLHGITGSGKTRVYMERIKEVLAQDKNVLLLYPEISLTSQLESTLKTHFTSDIIHTYHSKLTPSKQRQTWLSAIQSSKGQIFIGPRSALFLPIKNIGLVVVDEAHDNSYKQDSGIRYNGLLVASAVANSHSAQLLLGSATPPVQETYQLLAKSGVLVCMHDVATKTTNSKSSYEIVDMREASQKSTVPYISKRLLQSINDALQQKSQVLLFLNKRGTSRVLQCEECGWIALCNKCDQPLTFHHDQHTLRCHLCGMSEKVPLVCPESGHELSQKRLGIKAIEAELKSYFHNAKIARFDSDNKKQESFSENYQDIADGNVDIILGTQLITKGMDLRNLSLVGILDADNAFMLPDFSSEERAFQQLTQVSGRVGRGHRSGKVVIQTHQPDNPLFSMIVSQDWHSFYELELANRQQTHYPPFTFAMKVWVSKKTESAAIRSIEKIKSSLRSQTSIALLGPAPSFYEKVGGEIRWQLILRAQSRNTLLEVLPSLPKDAMYDLDPVSLL